MRRNIFQKNNLFRFSVLFFALLLLLSEFVSCSFEIKLNGGTEITVQSGEEPESTAGPSEESEEPSIDENGSYYSRDDVALYIRTFGKLPQNFITKKEARALGWEGGSLEKYAPGKAIGGDYFGNYEGALPESDGREYHECDIDTEGKSGRGAKRIVYSNDGLIYYTEDHYETFVLLDGDE